MARAQVAPGVRGRVGKYTARGHRAHKSISYLRGGNPLAGGGNFRGGRSGRSGY